MTNPPTLTELLDRLLDDRLIFLARASARHLLVEVGEMTLDEAIAGLLAGDRCPLCERRRAPLAECERTARSAPVRAIPRRWRNRITQGDEH